MRRQHRALLVLAALVCFVPRSAPAKSPAAPSYHIVERFKVGGEGGWDYLTADPVAKRLYFGRSTRVQVLDVDTGKLLGEIPDTPGIHGVALAPALHRGFTSNGRDSSVTIFDLATLETITKVHIDGRNPDAILYEPTTRRVFTFNAGSANATALDAATGRIIGNVALGGQPEFAVADGHGRVFVNLEDSGAVVALDPKSLATLARWPLAPGEEPTGLAYDDAHHRLFSVCANRKMIVLDSATGRVVATVPIGEGPDGAAWDAATGLAFSSNGAGTVTVVHEDTPDRFTVVAEVPTQARARTMALDPVTHRLYLATAQFGTAPAPSAEHPHPRPPMIPDTFEILVLAR
jgi:DNA-binding beta-propeller fold protein YncE